ncbi:MAG: hypothetical protein LC118_07280 [Dehalococcoidia bacterium]|nr:hypothetical protein [Dehalococcoidia bacterium]
MPDRGRLDPSGITAGPLLRGEQAAPWVLRGARWAQVTFEADQAEVLAVLPEDLNRPVPAYARVVVLDAPTSPAGPLKMAALLAGGRYRLLPRNVLAEAVVDGPVREVAGAFGAPFVPGSVEAHFGAEGHAASIAVGEVKLAINLAGLRAVEPALLRWDPWLGFAGPGDNRDLIEYQFEPTISQAWLSGLTKLDMTDGSETGSPWARLQSVNQISSCICEGTLTLTVPEVLQALV